MSRNVKKKKNKKKKKKKKTSKFHGEFTSPALFLFEVFKNGKVNQRTTGPVSIT